MAERSPLRVRTSGELLAERERPVSSGELLSRVDPTTFLSLSEMEAALLPEQEDFTRGLRSTSYGLQEGRLNREADKAIAAGDLETGAELRAQAEGSARVAQDFAPRLRSHTDVKNVGDAIDFAQSGLGQVTPTMLPPMAAGLAGAAVGVGLAATAPVSIPLGIAAGIGGAAFASVPAFQMEAGEQASSQQHDEYIRNNTTAEERLHEQNVKGVQNAALESLFPAFFGGRLVGGAAKRIAGQALKKSPLRRTLAVGRETGIESGTEFTQTLTGQASLSRLNPNRDTTHDYVEQIDSIILGALGGSSMSLGTTVPGYIAEKAGQRLEREADTGARDLGRGVAEIELGILRNQAARGVDVSLRPSLMIDNLSKPDAELLNTFGERFVQAEGNPEAQEAVILEASLWAKDRDITEDNVVQRDEDILSRQAIAEGRPDALRLNTKTGEPTQPDVNMLDQPPVTMRPASTEGEAKFTIQHVRKGEERQQLLKLKREGFLDQAGVDAVQTQKDGRIGTPLGQWLQEKKAEPEEVQAEVDSMIRDLDRRLKPLERTKTEKGLRQKRALEKEKAALEKAGVYGDYYKQLDNYSVLEFPADVVQGRFTPQDAAQQQRSSALVTHDTPGVTPYQQKRERKANREKLNKEQGIRLQLKIGGQPRWVYRDDVIKHARGFFREELSSFKGGPAREEAALLMGVFADPRVKNISIKNEDGTYTKITQKTANLENPIHRAALKLDPPKRGYKFGKKPQDPAFSRAPGDQAELDIEPAQGEIPQDDAQQRAAMETEKLIAQRLRAEERLAEAKPGSMQARQANKDINRLTAQLKRVFDEFGGGVVDQTREAITEENPVIDTPGFLGGKKRTTKTPRKPKAPPVRKDVIEVRLEEIDNLLDKKYEDLFLEGKILDSAALEQNEQINVLKEERAALKAEQRLRRSQAPPVVGETADPVHVPPPIGARTPRTESPLTPRRPVAPPVRGEQASKRETSRTPELDKLPSYQAGQQTKTYAGVGSRTTPAAMLVQMRKVAARLAKAGYTLNSGAAEGADSAFEAGATKKNIFKADAATDQTRKIASEVHPAWGALRSPYVRNLMARNTNQIFGQNLDTPVDFVLAWTPDGVETSQERSIKTGGTGQAIDMASRKGIPVINLAKEGWEQRLEEVLSTEKTAQKETKNEAWQEGLPEHTIDRELKNKDGSKRLASTSKEGKIRINPVETVEEFFNYFEGKDNSPTSRQKKVVLNRLHKEWPRAKIRKLITTPDLANRFLVLHEADHVANLEADLEVYRRNKNIMSPGKIKIETRATKAALDKLAAEKQGIKPSKQVANDIIYGRWAENLKKHGYTLVEKPEGVFYIVDKDGKRVDVNKDKTLKKALSGIPLDLRFETLEEAMADPENKERRDAAAQWMIRAFGPEIVDKLGWMLAREGPQLFKEAAEAAGHPEAAEGIGNFGGLAGFYDGFSDFIRLAADALDPLSNAFHEGMHKFVKTLNDSGNPDVYQRLVKAATSPHVMKQMERLLKDYPQAIAQMRADPEEAVAYAFQFYAASRISGGPEFRLMNKKLFMRVIDTIKQILGIMTHARASEQIFDALYEGRVHRDGIEPLRKYQERAFKEYAKDVMQGIRHSVPRALSSPIIQLQRQKNGKGEQIKAFVKLANAWHSEPLKGGPSGLIYRGAQGDGQYRNRWHNILAKNNVTKEEMKSALLNFQSMREPRTQFEKDLKHFFARMWAYQFEGSDDMNPVKVLKVVDEETGRKEWVKPDKVKNYWARVWSTENILANEIEFREVMAAEGKLDDEVITNFIEMLQATNGVEAGSELQQYRAEFSPYNAAINARAFTFINEGNAHKFAKFQEQDMAKVMDRYIRQAVHRREHSRTFGHDGKVIKDLLKEAKLDGATPEQIAYAEKVVQGLEGRLGTDKVSDFMRETMVASMSITNFAVLAMATLSSMVDPLGVMVRTGSVKSAVKTFKAGFAQIINDARKTKTPDQVLTEYLGIIEEDMVQDMLNNMERGIYMNEKLRKMNKFFFKSIGLEQWTRGTRIGAMRASLEYLKKYKNDAKRMEEVGLKPGMIQEFEDRIKIKPEEFKTGEKVTPADIEKARLVQNAMFRMVDESVLRPSAATRPLWASDMRFRLLGHLKSYTFTFHNQILRQVFARAGNAESRAQAVLAFMPLLSYVPVMLAADMVRDMIQGDDKDRDWDETLERAIQRSAIGGMGTFFLDAKDEMDWGGLPTNTVLGPVIDSSLNLGRAAVNPEADFLGAAANMFPYKALWGKWGED